MRDSVPNAFFKLSASANDRLTIGVELSTVIFKMARNTTILGRRMSEVQQPPLTSFTGRSLEARFRTTAAGLVFTTLFINHVLCTADENP